MAVTLDGKTLHVKKLHEDVMPVTSVKDKWENESFKRNVRVVGSVKTWDLTCYEKAVKWADSAAKHLESKADAGDPVAFVVEVGTIADGKLHHVPSTEVKILKVAVTITEGEHDYREFTLKLIEQ